MKLLPVLAVTLATVSAGCFGWFGGDDAPSPADVNLPPEIPPDAFDRARNLFRNYTLPGQIDLPWTTLFYNDTVGPESNLAFENTRDEGGNDFNGVIKTVDVSAYLPPGQATEIAIRLFWNAAEGKSADLDIYVDVPGTRTSTAPGAEEVNFNVPIKTLVVNTVGVAGYPAQIGIQAANGRTAGDLPFTLEMSFSYAKDALTPHLAYGIPVPRNASALILESVKAAGDEHVRAKFVLIGPDDELVTYQEYDDIAVPTESIFIPVKGEGTYVFYAYEMHGGFLSVHSDVPLQDTRVRVLATKEESVVDATGPAPGLAARNWLAPNEGAATPIQGGTVVDVNIPTFPLSVRGFLDPSGMAGLTGMSQVMIESPRGLVSQVTRMARLDTDRGTLGYTDDEGQNNLFQPANLAKGPYKITIINNGNGAVGHTVLTYVR